MQTLQGWNVEVRICSKNVSLLMCIFFIWNVITVRLQELLQHLTFVNQYWQMYPVLSVVCLNKIDWWWLQYFTVKVDWRDKISDFPVVVQCLKHISQIFVISVCVCGSHILWHTNWYNNFIIHEKKFCLFLMHYIKPNKVV